MEERALAACKRSIPRHLTCFRIIINTRDCINKHWQLVINISSTSKVQWNIYEWWHRGQTKVLNTYLFYGFVCEIFSSASAINISTKRGHILNGTLWKKYKYLIIRLQYGYTTNRLRWVFSLCLFKPAQLFTHPDKRAPFCVKIFG